MVLQTISLIKLCPARDSLFIHPMKETQSRGLDIREKRAGIRIALAFILAFASIACISAEIIISQPKTIYNLGDELNIQVMLSELTSGYLHVHIVCDTGNDSSIEIYKNVPDTKTISIKRNLIPEYIEDLYGNCYLLAEYGDKNQISQSFQISKEIELLVQNIAPSYDAGETINVRGTATKKNGQLFGQIYSASGEASLKDIAASGIVRDGQFTLNLQIPETMHAGKYNLHVGVHDEDSKGNLLNSASKNIEVEIIQKPAKLNAAIDKQSITPGENVSIIPSLYDKAGDSVAGDVLIKITDSNGREIFLGNIELDKKFVLETETNYSAGETKVVLQKNSINFESIISVSELKKIESTIKNETLVIKNIGNVAYKEIISVIIGNKTILKDVDLDVGESKEYSLSAPDGNYDVGLKDSTGSIFSQSGIPITGRAISVEEVNSRLNNIVTKYPVVWIFLILLAAIIIYVLYKKREERKKFGYLNETKTSPKGGVEIVRTDKEVDKLIFGETARKAEHVGVLHGQKQLASIIAIKIKNGIFGISKENMNKALEYAYRAKAVSYTTGDSILLVFSPIVTGKRENEKTAIKVAMEIDEFLREHNRKFRNDKIDYGIGVNCGEIINKMEGQILQFSSINKTVGFTKRIAELANDQVLLSKDIHEKTAGSVRTEKFSSGAMDLFTIKRVVNSEESEKFIRGFLKRN